MNSKGLATGLATVLALFIIGAPVFAQDQPATDADQDSGDGKGRFQWPLYVEAATGGMSADDLNTSISTSSTDQSVSTFTIDDQVFARAAIGWKLADGKGDFRLEFNGYKEDTYEFNAQGLQATLDPLLGQQNTAVLGNLVWWTLGVRDGELSVQRTPPQWDVGLDDANGNDAVDPDEVRYIGADLAVTKDFVSDMQNRVQTVDMLYGRTFGSRRFGARWWGGLRYFTYKGNIPGAAWLNTAEPGEGFTEGSFISLLNFPQKSTGYGPLGVLEADFKFFDDRLVLFVQGQASYMVLNIEVDTGPFKTFVQVLDPGRPEFTVPIDARLSVDRNKSTWQDRAEAGVRVNLKNGLQLELAYSITGYLDAVLLPNEIQIPGNVQESGQGTSALYNTQDLVFDGWTAGIAFQF